MKKILSSKISLIIFSFIATFFIPTWISNNNLSFSNSPIAILFVVIFYLAFNYSYNQSISVRKHVCSYILGLMLSIFVAFGNSLNTYNEIHYKSIIFVISILLFSYVLQQIILILWNFLAKTNEWLVENREFHDNNKNKLIKVCDVIFSKFFLIAILLFIFWLPSFFADFPGGFRYDASRELNQTYAGYMSALPLLHSFIITKFLPWCNEKFGSYNVGIALYVIIQMILLALMYSHIITTLYKRRVNEYLLFVSFCYISFFPVIQILVTQVLRDVMFAGLLSYTIFWFYLFFEDKTSFLHSKWKPIILALLIALTIQSRNNDASKFMHLLIYVICIVMIVFNIKKNWGGTLIFSISLIVIYFLLSKGLYYACSPFNNVDYKRESYTIVSQTLARTYNNEYDALSEEEKEQYAEFFYINDENKIDYYPKCGDISRWKIKDRDSYAELIKFWFRVGINHKSCYFDAILQNSEGLWFPNALLDGYNDIYTDHYSTYDKCYYDYMPQIEEPGERHSKIQWLSDFFEYLMLKKSFEKIPIISMLFSIGFQYWVLLNCLFYNIALNNKKYYMPILILLAYMSAGFFLPLIIMRYFCAVFFSMPMIFLFTFQPQVKAEKNVE